MRNAGLISGNHDFSWVFLVDWIMAIILTVFVLFFFNRLAGWLVSHAVKWFIWHKYRVVVNVQAVQISLLGGRVFFKNISYVGSNQALTAIQGNITWRYWLPRTRIAEIRSEFNDSQETTTQNNSKAPIRIKVQLSGLEWFIYNRSPAYDAMMEGFEQKHGSTTPSESSFNDSEKPATHSQQPSEDDSKRLHTQDQNSGPYRDDSMSETLSELINSGKFIQNTALFSFLPMEIVCSKGALVAGNKTTSSVAVIYFASGSLVTDAAPSKSQLDEYRLKARFLLNKTVVEFRPNMDYSDNQKKAKHTNKFFGDANRNQGRDADPYVFMSLVKLGVSLFRYFITLPWKWFGKRPPIDDHQSTLGDVPYHHWHGLSRYHMYGSEEASLNVHYSSEIMDEEYGKNFTILDAPRIDMTYYHDVAGKVPKDSGSTDTTRDGPEIGNSGSPPEWGLDVTMTDSTISYGPWANRERVSLHSMFIPRSLFDSKPEPRRQPGQWRLATQFKLFIEFQGDTIIRIPTRESSKNSHFAAELKRNPHLSHRPYGWLELKASSLSTFSYTQAMVPDVEGWASPYQLHLIDPELRSSVNHGILLQADEHDLTGSIVNPHQWNGLQTWNLNNSSRNVKVFLLREHVTLITDTLSDFSSGPPTPYELFTPVAYNVSWDFADYGLYLNVNDKNVINNPSDFEDNIFLSFQGRLLQLKLLIKLLEVEPTTNHFNFSLTTDRFDLIVDTPPWHTVQNFSNAPTNGVGRAYNFILDGSYTFASLPSPAAVDTLIVDCSADTTTLICHGYVLKYIMKIRENYFGEFAHFQTLEELNEHPVERKSDFTLARTETAIDVLLYVYVNGGSLVLPANLYDVESYCRLDFASFDTDCRFTSYYMDLQMNITPMKGRFERGDDRNVILDLAKTGLENESQIFIDGLIIHGHRLFGLPPKEPTYFCKWDFDVGEILVSGPMTLKSQFQMIMECAIFTFDDYENSLVPDEPPLYDVTFVSAKLSSIKVRLYDPNESSFLESVTSAIEFNFNDLANERYSAKARLTVPKYRVAMLDYDAESAEAHVLASFESSLVATNFMRKQNPLEFRRLQQEHIMYHDAEFKRCPFLLEEEYRYSSHYTSVGKNTFIPASCPAVPPPLTKETVNVVEPNTGLGYSSAASSYEQSQSRSPDKTTDHFLTGDHVYFHSKELPESEFLPSRTWGIFDDLSSDEPVDFDLNPRSHRKIVPTAHHTSSDKSAKQGNFICQLGPIECYSSPPIFNVIADFLESLEYTELSDVLDFLQVSFMEKFKLRLLTYITPEIDTLRVIAPSLNIKYGELEGNRKDSEKGSENGERKGAEGTVNDDIRDAGCSPVSENEQTTGEKDDASVSSFNAYAYATFTNMNLVMRFAKTKTVTLEQVMKHQELNSDKTVYFSLENMLMGVENEENRSIQKPLTLLLDRLEFSWHEADKSSGFLRIQTFDVSVVSEQIPWLTEFIAHNVMELRRLHEGRLERRPRIEKSEGKKWHSNHDRMMFLIYELVEAGEKYKITHDPSVLTKPAYIIQSSDHIRTTTSWKLLMRLRHVYQSLPEEWKQEQNAKLQKSSFEVPSNAREIVTQSFSNWRSWELSNVPMCYLLRYVFVESSLTSHIISIATQACIDLESIGFRVHHADDEEFLLLDYLKALLNWKQMDHTVQISEDGSIMTDADPALKTGFRVDCDNIRSRFTYKLLDVAEAVRISLEKYTDLSASTNDSSKKQPMEFPSVILSGSVGIVNGIMEFLGPSFALKYEGQEGESSLYWNSVDEFNLKTMVLSWLGLLKHFTVELMDEYQGSKRAMYIESSNVLTYSTFNGNPITAEKIIQGSSSRLTWNVDYTAQNLTDFFTRLMEIDYPHLKKALSLFQTRSASVEKPQDSLDGLLSSVGPFNVLIMTECLDLCMPVFSQLGFDFIVDDALLNFVFTKEKIFKTFPSVKRLELALFGDERHKRLVEFSLNEAKLMCLVDRPEFLAHSQVATDMMVNIASIDVHSASIPFVVAHILQLVQSNELQQIEKSVQRLKSHLPSTMQSENSKPKMGYSMLLQQNVFKFQVKIQGLAIHMPVEDQLAIFGLENLTLNTATYNPAADVGYSVIPLFVDVDIRSVFARMRDMGSSRNIPKILDFHFEMSYKTGTENETIHCISSSIRVTLSSSIMLSLAKFTDGLSQEIAKVRDHGLSMEKKTESIHQETSFITAAKDWTSKNRLTFVLRDGCVAWLFGNEVTDPVAPGVLVGYDTFYVVVNSGAMEMNVSGIYGTYADKRTIFLPRPCTLSRANSIVLSKVEILSSMTKTRDKDHLLTVITRGKSIDVTLLPTIATMLTDLYLSLSRTNTEIKSTTVDEQKDSRVSHDGKTERTSGRMSFPLSFCVQLDFAAASINLWEQDEFILANEPVTQKRPTINEAILDDNADASKGTPPYAKLGLPSVSLKTPSVTGYVRYLKSRDISNEADRFRSEINITPSTNTIYPKSVKALAETMLLLRKGLVNNSQKLAKPKESESRYQLNPNDVDQFLEDIDIRMGLRLFRQEVTFSCLPAAKVQATGSVDHVYASLDVTNCAEMRGRLTSILLDVKNLKTSLQHVYSRDISGYLTVQDVLVAATRMKKSTEMNSNTPTDIGTRIQGITMDVNVKQMQELELFKDIWITQYFEETKRHSWPSRADNKESKGLSAKNRVISSRDAMPFTLSLSILNAVGKADMGQSIGKISLVLDEIWLSMYQLPNWQQDICIGMKKLHFVSEGRLGSLIAMEGLHTEVTVDWVSKDEEYLPIVEISAGLDLIEAKTTLDYHTFFISVVERLNFATSNKWSPNSDEALIVFGDCESINVFLTDLAASFFLDIIYTFKRLRVETNAGYAAIIDEGRETESFLPTKGRSRSIMDNVMNQKHLDGFLTNILTGLKVALDVRLTEFNFYIFPHSFNDADVFTLSVRNAKARFEQQTVDIVLQSKLSMSMEQAEARLAHTRKSLSKDIGVISPRLFMKETLANARGGIIISIPIVKINMETWQKEGSAIIEHTYESDFGGKVEIGWNLGSINFIRDMWADHARAYSTRQSAYHLQSNEMLSARDIDERFRDVKLSTEYSYIPRKPPVIVGPQLREMGEATPPIEWIGLNRQKFPGMTHQIVIRGLQEFVKEIERVYGKVIGGQ